MAVSGEGELFKLLRVPDGDRDAWLEQRRKGVGGSDVAPIMDLSKWRSCYEVWAEKVGLIQPADLSDKESVQWGNILEPVVGAHYSELHPDRTVRRVNAVCQSIGRPWAQASLDYEVKDPELGWGVLEIKTAGLRSEGDWSEGVPVYYQTQVAHYLSVTGRKFADVAVLIGGQEYREYRIMRDEEDIAAVNKAVDDFWSMVEDRVEPPVEPAGQALKAFAKEHPSDGAIVELDREPGEFNKWYGSKLDLDAMKKMNDRYAAKLMERIGDKKGLSFPEGRVVWVRSESSRFDSKRFKEEHPDLWAEYQTTSIRNGGLKFYPAKNKEE